MKRGEIYRVRRPPGDPRPARSFVIASRQALIDSAFSTVICAPIFSARGVLPTQVAVGAQQGLKHDSAIHCDGLVSLEKAKLTDYVGALSPAKMTDLDAAITQALAIEVADRRG